MLDAEQEVWSFIESKVALIVRSQIEISERISSKGLNDPVLEQMLATIPDPFGSYGPPKQDGEIFSILPPISLLSSAANSVHNTSTEAATNDTSVTDGDLTSEEARAASGTAANASSKSKSVLPANIMSPSTPSKGLSRAALPNNLSASVTPTRSSHSNTAADELPSSSTPRAKSTANAASAATPKARDSKATSSLNGRTHIARDSLLGLSTVSEATTAVSAATDSSHAPSGGLFGSESVDFEELLSREQLRKDASEDEPQIGDESKSDGRPAAQADSLNAPSSSDATDEGSSGGNATAAGRLRQVLSIIEEDANGPLSKAAKMGTASRPVSSIYDAGPDPFADHVVESRRAQSSTSSQEEDGATAEQQQEEQQPEETASRHRRTPSKLSID